MGRRPTANATELLASPRLAQLIEEAKNRYEFLVVDSPPLLVYAADVRMLATVTDTALLTLREGVTTRDAVSEAMAQLPRLLGVVLNGFDTGVSATCY